MIAARGLVVIMVVLEVEGRVLRHGVGHAAAQGILAALVVREPLGVHGYALGIAGLLAVLGVKIAIGVHPAHVIHGGGHGSLDPGVQTSPGYSKSSFRRRCQPEARPAHSLPVR